MYLQFYLGKSIDVWNPTERASYLRHIVPDVQMRWDSDGCNEH